MTINALGGSQQARLTPLVKTEAKPHQHQLETLVPMVGDRLNRAACRGTAVATTIGLGTALYAGADGAKFWTPKMKEGLAILAMPVFIGATVTNAFGPDEKHPDASWTKALAASTALGGVAAAVAIGIATKGHAGQTIQAGVLGAISAGATSFFTTWGNSLAAQH